jgi:hypothetical protein
MDDVINLIQYAKDAYTSNKYTGLESVKKELHCQYIYTKFNKTKQRRVKNVRSK